MRPQSPRRSCSPPVKSRWFRPKITPTCRRDGSTLQGRLGPRPRVRLLLLDTLRATEVLVLYRHQFTEVTSTFVVICFCEQHDIFGLGAKSVMHLSNFFGRHKNIFFESLRAKTTSLSFFKRCVLSNKKMRTAGRMFSMPYLNIFSFFQPCKCRNFTSVAQPRQRRPGRHPRPSVIPT